MKIIYKIGPPSLHPTYSFPSLFQTHCAVYKKTAALYQREIDSHSYDKYRSIVFKLILETRYVPRKPVYKIQIVEQQKAGAYKQPVVNSPRSSSLGRGEERRLYSQTTLQIVRLTDTFRKRNVCWSCTIRCYPNCLPYIIQFQTQFLKAALHYSLRTTR